jgi:hypothetical protein
VALETGQIYGTPGRGTVGDNPKGGRDNAPRQTAQAELLKRLEPVVADAAERVVRREASALARAWKKLDGAPEPMVAWAVEWYNDNEETITEMVTALSVAAGGDAAAAHSWALTHGVWFAAELASLAGRADDRDALARALADWQNHAQRRVRISLSLHAGWCILGCHDWPPKHDEENEDAT